MIRINVLPPELRKRQGGGFNQTPILLAAGVLLSAACAGGWAWVHFKRIPHVRDVILVEAEKAYQDAREQADVVRELEAKVDSFKARLNQLTALTDRKVEHAEMVNSFVNLLTGERWSVPGFRIACLRLAITPEQRSGRGRGAAGDDSIRYAFDWEMELVGNRYERTGDYVAAFFDDVRTSDFWIRYGFLGEPVEPYRGEYPEYDEKLEKVIVTHALTWIRDQAKQVENQRLLEDGAALDGSGEGG